MKLQERPDNSREEQPEKDKAAEIGSENERAEEAMSIRQQLDKINAEISDLERLFSAAKKAALTKDEMRARDVKVEKMMQSARDMGSEEEIVRRIGEVAKVKFTEELRAGQIAESPKGRELERLKNRQFDLTERLRELESEE